MRVRGEKTQVRIEDASHAHKKWVRLTRACNNNCLFCLDHCNLDGTMIPDEEITRELKRGIAEGATQAVLSGGEPTIHPRFIDIIGEAADAGYTSVQVISNGRMFSYSDFLDRCVEAGLREITFAIHACTPELGDTLAGTAGAFEQSIKGLAAALGRPGLIVSMNIVANRLNIGHLESILRNFIAMGVREFDIQQLIPFGRCWDNMDNLAFDLREKAPLLRGALKAADMPGVKVWTNRMPPPALEGLEHMIQRPLKLVDEVLERREMFDDFFSSDIPLPCAGPRCAFCRMHNLCSFFSEIKTQLLNRDFDSLVLRRSDFHLAERLREFEDMPLIIHGADLLEEPAVKRALSGRCAGLKTVCRTLEEAEALLSADHPCEPEAALELNHDTAGGLLETDLSRYDRLSITVPNRMAVEDCLALDVGIGAFMERYNSMRDRSAAGPVFLNTPPCITGGNRFIPLSGIPLETAIAPSPDLVSLTRHFIEFHDYHQSYRCSDCIHRDSCRGLHINHIRAFGFRQIPGPVARA